MKRAVAMALIVSVLLIGGCSTHAREESFFEDMDSREIVPTNMNSQVKKVKVEDLTHHFEGFDGTFIMFDKNAGEYLIYNEPKSEKRMPPCSTFKVPNALIGLETGVIQDENSLYQWDGKQHSIEEWNRDHTLASAVKYSVVWYFQKLAGNVGSERMQRYLDRIDYGNKDISGGIDKFWLQSSLEISPLEQVVMLRKLYDYQLPFSRRNIDIVKAILVDSVEDGVTLSGKTGSAQGVNGWFIGYVETEGNVYFFATNIEGEQQVDGIKAKEITIRILNQLNIFSKENEDESHQ